MAPRSRRAQSSLPQGAAGRLLDLPDSNLGLIIAQPAADAQPRLHRRRTHRAGFVDHAGTATARRLEAAIWGLWRRAPYLSAWRPLATPWQKASLGVLATSGATALWTGPDALLLMLSALLALPFLCLTLLRSLAIAELVRPSRAGPAAIREVRPAPDDDVPSYSILVPLYDEVAALPYLVAALSALDYPRSRLEILLVLEAHDRATREAAAALQLPAHFKFIVVPPGGPQTKPKALNYALELVRGDYVVVFDAEDRPEPGQLRAALAAFQVGHPDLACLQARLNIYNPRDSLLTRQFTLEYSALFDAVLPALERLSLPLPLGGTSNHFPTALLRQAGGWDPYNVTEDADLGIRLARLGFKTATLPSTTWEEAPDRLGNWFGQRSRWFRCG